MSLTLAEKKIIASIIKDAENEVINQAILENNENMQYYIRVKQNYRPTTPPVNTTCSCMCRICGSGPLAPSPFGSTDLCASCR